MRKHLAIIGLFGALATIGFLEGQGTPNSAPENRITKADQSHGGSHKADTNNADNPARYALSSPAASHPSPNTAQNDPRKQDDELSIQRKVEWFTGILAFVSIVQSAVLVLTWLAIRRQAHLQAFLTRQWVDVGDWSLGGDGAWEKEWEVNRAERTATETSRQLKDSMSMGISFEVFNRTAYPLQLDKIVVFLGKVQKQKWYWEVFEDKAGTVVPPHVVGSDTSEHCTVHFMLDSEDEVFRYTKNCLYRRVHVRVIFLDSERKMIRQEFGIEVFFGETLTKFSRYNPREMRKVKLPRSEF